jgi:V-type H+-transporting ATPase subunit a
MQYVSLIVQGHVAHDTLEALGELGAISFADLNGELTPFQRRFTRHIRRCDEMERIVRYFEGEMAKYNVKPQVRGGTTLVVATALLAPVRCAARRAASSSH